MSTENQKIDIILDCDPGYDDAAAILLAAGNPNVNILAITVVAGNQSIAKVTRNALAIAQVAGLHDVPIAAGATRPLMIEPEVAAEIHGETGLDDATLPDEIVLKTDPRHAVQVTSGGRSANLSVSIMSRNSCVRSSTSASMIASLLLK